MVEIREREDSSLMLALAEVLRLTDPRDETEPIVERALALYEGKQNSVSAERARTALDAWSKGRSYERAT